MALQKREFRLFRATSFFPFLVSRRVKLNLPRPKAGCDLQSEPALPACVQISPKMRIRKRASVVLQLFDERYYILHASAGNQNHMHVFFFETPAKSV